MKHHNMKKIPYFALCLSTLTALFALSALTSSTHAQEKPDPIKECQKFVDSKVSTGEINKALPTWKTTLPKFKDLTFAPGQEIYWNLVTSEGIIQVKFYPDAAPRHVSNFMYLTQLGYFDDLKFHRIIKDFMAQGGCPLGTGTGSPGYKIDGEFDSGIKHTKPGLLSAANAGPGTDGSQFFLTFKATPWLDGKHTIFGEVINGMETLKKMELLAGVPPTKDIIINKATITRGKDDPIKFGPEAPAPQVGADPITENKTFIAEQISAGTLNKRAIGWRTQLPMFKSLTFDPNKTYLWHLDTSAGKMTFKFMPDIAPNHVSNFIYLSELDYFNGLDFHRVISRFMAQGGCPLGNGRGNPGYKFGSEVSDDVIHDRSGLLSMANAGQGTDGSQFFITFTEAPGLDGKHTIFAEIIDGKSTVLRLESLASKNPQDTAPTKEIIIRSARVSAK